MVFWLPQTRLKKNSSKTLLNFQTSDYLYVTILFFAIRAEGIANPFYSAYSTRTTKRDYRVLYRSGKEIPDKAKADHKIPVWIIGCGVVIGFAKTGIKVLRLQVDAG